MKYPREFSLFLRLTGIVFLVFFLCSETFGLSQQVKHRLMRTGALSISIVFWRYFEEFKKKEENALPLLFFIFLFAGIFNAFFPLIRMTSAQASFFLAVFLLTACAKLVLSYKYSNLKKLRVIAYPLLGLFSFLSLAG